MYSQDNILNLVLEIYLDPFFLPYFDLFYSVNQEEFLVNQNYIEKFAPFWINFNLSNEFLCDEIFFNNVNFLFLNKDFFFQEEILHKFFFYNYFDDFIQNNVKINNFDHQLILNRNIFDFFITIETDYDRVLDHGIKFLNFIYFWTIVDFNELYFTKNYFYSFMTDGFFFSHQFTTLPTLDCFISIEKDMYRIKHVEIFRDSEFPIKENYSINFLANFELKVLKKLEVKTTAW